MNLFPKQRGNVKVDNSRFLDAIIYICENGCTWRALPETFGLCIPSTSESTVGQKTASWNGFFTLSRRNR
jgi:transposase